MIAAKWASFGARASFGAAVLLIPFRLHLLLVSRPQIPVYTDYTDFQLYASDVAVLATLALWIISLAAAPRRVNFGPRHIWVPMIGLILAAWISTRSSFDPLLSVYHGIRLIALFWFYVYIVNEIPSLPWITVPVALQAIVQSVIALGQFIVQRSVGLAQIGEQGLNPAAPGTSVITANGERLLRAYGLTDHPNILGGCLAFSLVLLILPVLRSSRRSAAYAVFIPASAALLVTFSRAAWIALGAGGLMIIAWELVRRRWAAAKRLLWLAAAAALLPLAILVAYRPFFGVRLDAGGSFVAATAEQQSLGERLILIQKAVPMLMDHALTGIGIGATPEALQVYYPKFGMNYEPPHWALFDAALETGVLGAVSDLALLLFPFVAAIHRRRSLSLRADAIVALAILLAVTTVGFFDYYTWLLPAGRLWQWLAWGIWGMALERPLQSSADGIPTEVQTRLNEPAYETRLTYEPESLV